MYYDSSFLLLIPALIIAAYAQFKVKGTFRKYNQVPSQKGYTGRDVARSILDRSGLSDVQVLSIRGELTDHYDPRQRVVRLSESVYNKSSIAAVSVAAHEVGHAIQHQEGYAPLTFRSLLAPIAGIASQSVWILILLGIIFSIPSLIDIGIVVFSITVLFQIITLPVEFNASKRAIAQLEGGYLTAEETSSSRKVLNAAALTYVAATLVAIAQLLRLVLLSNSRRD